MPSCCYSWLFWFLRSKYPQVTLWYHHHGIYLFALLYLPKCPLFYVPLFCRTQVNILTVGCRQVHAGYFFFHNQFFTLSDIRHGFRHKLYYRRTVCLKHIKKSDLTFSLHFSFIRFQCIQNHCNGS